jgi:hypothetical protein
LCSAVKFKEKDPQIWKRMISGMCFNSHAAELLRKDLKQLRAVSDSKAEEYSDTAVERLQLTAVLRRNLQVGNLHFFEADNIIEFEHMMDVVMLTKKMYEEA